MKSKELFVMAFIMAIQNSVTAIEIEKKFLPHEYTKLEHCNQYHDVTLFWDMDTKKQPKFYFNLKTHIQKNEKPVHIRSDSKVKIWHSSAVGGCNKWERISNYVQNNSEHHAIIANLDGCSPTSGYLTINENLPPHFQITYELLYRSEIGKSLTGEQSDYAYALVDENGLIGKLTLLEDNAKRMWLPPSGSPPLVSSVCVNYRVMLCSKKENTCYGDLVSRNERTVTNSPVFQSK